MAGDSLVIPIARALSQVSAGGSLEAQLVILGLFYGQLSNSHSADRAQHLSEQKKGLTLDSFNTKIKISRIFSPNHEHNAHYLQNN